MPVDKRLLLLGAAVVATGSLLYTFRHRIFGSLISTTEGGDGGEEDADLHHVPPPDPKYIIIGRGFAAVNNHATLRKSEWGEQRLRFNGEILPVTHIGHADPWRHYRRHHMGQFPFALGLPGFPQRYTDLNQDEPLNSRVFAASTRAVLEGLEAKADTLVTDSMNAWVALIEHKDRRATVEQKQRLRAAPFGFTDIHLAPLLEDYNYEATPYRLLVVHPDKTTEAVYATKVDICSGTGVNRKMRATGTVSADGVIHDAVYTAYSEPFNAPWVPLEDYGGGARFMMSGQHAMYANFPLADAGEGTRIAIEGTGGIGVNLVEVTLDGAGTRDDPSWSARWVDWVTSKWHRFTAFPPSLRNDPLANADSLPAPTVDPECEHRYTEMANRLDGNEDFTSLPGHNHLRFGTGTGILNVGNNNQITFGPNARKGADQEPETHDSAGHSVDIDNGNFPYHDDVASPDIADNIYHQLFYTAGFENGATAVGSVGYLSSPLGAATAITPSAVGDNRMIGLQFADPGGEPENVQADRSVRILGVPCWTHPNGAGGPRNITRAYIEELPIQLQVGPPGAAFGGVTMNGLSIALANQFYRAENINPNVNTMSAPELLGRGLTENIVERIIAIRRIHPRGFMDLNHLVAALNADGGDAVVVDTLVDAGLTTVYPAPPVDRV